MKPIGGSGAATIAADTIARLRGIVSVLRYDVVANFPSLPTEKRLEVYERVERYLAEANEIEVELKRFMGATP